MKISLKQKFNNTFLNSKSMRNQRSVNFCGDNYHKDFHLNARSSSNGPIPNFRQVDDGLLRGAQPNFKQFENLQKRGVGLVVNLRTLFVSGLPFDEKNVVEDLGMRYKNIPIITKDGPSVDDVKKFFSVVEETKSKGQKTFVHCMAGQDRTGAMCALYKIKKAISTPQEAFNEMLEIGHNQKRYPDLIGKLKGILKKL